MDKVLAYYRKKRKVYGVRNHVLILPTTFCVNRIGEMIWEPFRNVRWGRRGENRVVIVRHEAGCCHVGFDRDMAFNSLLGVASHPNVYGVLLVSLGCGQFCKPPLMPGEKKPENLERFKLYDRLIKRGVRVYWVNVQERTPLRGFGDSVEQAVEMGRRFVQKLVSEAKSIKRVEAPLSKFVLGVGNGASDPTSGLFANPALGHVVDHFISRGGTVVFSQTIELLGAEEFLLRKVDDSNNKRVRMKLKRLLETTIVLKEALQEYLGESDPTPGNIRSGISTLSEKSIGTVLKIGHDFSIKIRDVVPFSSRIPRNGGLYFMDSPGDDLLAISGMVSGGAHVIAFTTGLGTPIGSAVAPVIKVTANRRTFELMRNIIDVYIPVERIFEENMKLKDIAIEEIYPYLIDVMSGRRITRAEATGQLDFAVKEYWMRT